MPFIQLVTSSDLAENAHIPDILTILVEKLSTFDTINSRDIKSFHCLVANWVTGIGCQPGFAAVKVEILEGRPQELLDSIATGMFEVLTQCFLESLAADLVNLTLEVRQMEKATYRK